MAKKPNLQPQNDGYATVHTVRIPLWPYLVPLLFCLAAWPVTYGAHRAFGTSAISAGWTGVAITCASIGVLIFTFFLSRPRGVVMQVMSLVNAGLAIAWCVPAIIEGPATMPKFGFWLLFTLFICFDCAVYRIMRQSRGPEDPRHGVINGELAEFGEAVKQLKGAKFTPPVIEGAKVSSQVAMPAGRSFEEVSGARKEVASLLDVPATAIRTIPDRDSERRGTVVAVPVDQLREPRPAPPLEPGLSMADPILLGVDENGDYVEIILPGDPQVNRNAVGVFGVVGMAGSGKSELLLHVSKQIATRVDGELNVIDCRKEGQLPGWLRRAAKQMMSGKDEALDWLDSLEQRIAERARWLGERGYKQWVRGCGLPFETYLIFEAASIIRDSNIVDLAESVRSVGIGIGLELQRATYDRLPTSARANMPTWVTLGVQREGDAEGALTDDQVAAGAAPWKWGNGHPGKFYLSWSGRPEETWASPCRSFEPEDEEVRAAEVAAALGWADDAPAADPVPQVPAPRGGQEPDDHEAEPDEQPQVPPGVNPEYPPDDVDPAEPIVMPPDMPTIAFGDSRKPMLPADALGLLRSHVYMLTQAGAKHVQPVDLGDVLAQTGLSASWLRNALKRLCSEGVLREPRAGERGVYRIVQPERAPAGAGV